MENTLDYLLFLFLLYFTQYNAQGSLKIGIEREYCKFIKMCIFCWYVGETSVDSRLEEFNVIMGGEASSRESVPRFDCDLCVEILPYQGQG